MQLKRIQLVGFKSFVDATSIPILSQMNAIVGPNGCGKSNIVDAIRWVIGETSAKQLRGQLMSDVIFNGTSGRKPVGKASVELVFDNSDHRITGEYAAFTEISIRREVVRDGQSNYFINGVPARRRDLVDLFLGTGFGPRSYAIIEQGTIAQLVEAKPEDLRTHLEEVAGISKYRERRRETDNRIRHTQDNLDRLQDLQDEFEKQLHHLQRQSNAAEQYKTLKQKQRFVQAQMKALQWKSYEAQLIQKNAALAECAVEFEATLSAQRECEKSIEKTRLQSQTLLDQKNEIQKTFYGVGAEIARLEQQIAHKQEQLKQWDAELIKSESLFQELQTQATAHSDKIATLNIEIATLAPQQAELQSMYKKANQVLLEAEQLMRQSQQDWDHCREQSAQTNQQIEVTKNNIRHYENQLQQFDDRHTQLQAQLNAVSLAQLSDEIHPLVDKTESLKKAVETISQTLRQVSQSICDQRRLHQESQTALSQQQGELQKKEAQAVSLAALQQAASQDHQIEMRPWLEQHGLSQKLQLGKMIQVDAGWESAVEMVLGDYFHALCLDDFDALLNAVNSLSKGQMTFLQPSHDATFVSRLSEKTLYDVVTGCDHLPSGMSHIYLVDQLAEALQLKSTLQANESIVTREGFWVGSNWMRVSKSQSTEESFLVREKKLQRLKTDIKTQQIKLSELQEAKVSAQKMLEQLEVLRDSEHHTFQTASNALTQTQTVLSAKQSRLETVTQHQQRLSAEMTHIESQCHDCRASLQASHETLHDALDTQQKEATHNESLLAARSKAELYLTTARTEAQLKKQAADQWNIRLTSNENQLVVLMQSLQTNHRQLSQLTERRETLQSQLFESDAPLVEWSATLQSLLGDRVAIDAALREIEVRLRDEQHELKRLETLHELLIKSLALSQESQQQLRMAQQEILVRQVTVTEQITEMQFSLEALIEKLPDDANFTEWESTVNKLQATIDRLGPINLAAIDEYKTLLERKTYMDQQCTDLMEALAVLQNAIRKIDHETRHLFKDTFDQVNMHFQQLFPRIFGGGQALLELTEEDLLTTGIMVRAQPPGKRNATIHMLSGGEKALTTIALMFAMFQLNPAPFCVLDEVDAPLDDVNVGRYCQLVKAMSNQTQFLVISHNKVTIEKADHLMGVTMQEPGVSRIVSVDMQAAVSMVEA